MDSGFYKTNDINEDYKIQEFIGEGSFAKVYQAIRKSDLEEVAIKVFDKRQIASDEQYALEQEVDIMKAIDHPNIVKLYAVYDNKTNYYMVLELMTGGELFDRIVEREHYSEQEACEVFKPIVDSINYCHKMGIAHRDLKPENILYSTPDESAIIKISDFGLAKVVTNEKFFLSTACGTPSYMAPEVLNGKKYDNSVDFWSIGCILYILLCGYPPFYGETNSKLIHQISSGQIEFASPEWDGISQSAKDLVTKLLQVNPNERFNADQILEHPWVRGEGQNKNHITGVTDKIRNIQKIKTEKKVV